MNAATMIVSEVARAVPRGAGHGWHVVRDVSEPCCTITKIMAQDLDEAGKVNLT